MQPQSTAVTVAITASGTTTSCATTGTLPGIRSCHGGIIIRIAVYSVCTNAVADQVGKRGILIVHVFDTHVVDIIGHVRRPRAHDTVVICLGYRE